MPPGGTSNMCPAIVWGSPKITPLIWGTLLSFLDYCLERRSTTKPHTRWRRCCISVDRPFLLLSSSSLLLLLLLFFPESFRVHRLVCVVSLRGKCSNSANSHPTHPRNKKANVSFFEHNVSTELSVQTVWTEWGERFTLEELCAFAKFRSSKTYFEFSYFKFQAIYVLCCSSRLTVSYT